MADNMSSREKKAATESRRRTINYIVIAALAALVVTVLFLFFGRTDKGANDSKVNAGTGTEQVNTPGTSQPSGTVTRPASTTVTRPGSSDTQTAPSGSGRVDYPQKTKWDVINKSDTAISRNHRGGTRQR